MQVLCIAALTAILFGPTLFGLATDWVRPEFSQGLSILPLALIAAWRKRHTPPDAPRQTDARGLFLLAFASFAFLAGKLASELYTMRESFVLLLAALAWSFWGWPRLKSLAIPLLLLASAVPLPAIVSNMLMARPRTVCADAAVHIAQSLGVSLYQDGDSIQLSNGAISVSDACGLLACALPLGVAAFLPSMSLSKRLVLCALGGLLTLFAATVRIAGTVALVDRASSFAPYFYHAFAGWLVFLAASALLWATRSLLR